MLEDGSTQSVVCWGSKRDCFVVNNINEFSKTVLPQVFNHSNFPSFVRQLNKYDFHKVKQTEFNQPGEQTATFRHPDFHGDRPDDLQKIKRKVTPSKTSAGTSSGSIHSDNVNSNTSSSSSLPYASSSNSRSYPRSSNSNSDQGYSRSNDLISRLASQASVKVEVNHLRGENEVLKAKVRDLEETQGAMQLEMSTMRRAVAEQNGQIEVLMNLLHSFSVQSNPSIRLALAQTVSNSASMSTSSPAAESTSMITGNIRPVGSLTDPDQYHLLLGDEYPSDPGLQPQELLSRVQQHQRIDRSEFSARNVGPHSVRLPENMDVQHVVHFEPATSVSLIPVFGNLGQVRQATLLQTREVGRRTAADLSRKAHQDAGLWTGMDIDEGGSYTTSEWSSDTFSPAHTSHQIRRNTETGKRRRDAEDRFLNVHRALGHGQTGQPARLDSNMERFRQHLDNPTFGLQTLPEGNVVAGMGAYDMDVGVGPVGRRGRSLSVGDEEFQARRPLGVVPSQSGRRAFGSQGVRSFVNSEHEIERERGHAQRSLRRRGSDDAPFRPGDDAGGVDIDMLQLPLAAPPPIPFQTPGAWSFDTAVLARDGILHDSDIGGPPHTSEPRSQNPDADAMSR